MRCSPGERLFGVLLPIKVTPKNRGAPSNRRDYGTVGGGGWQQSIHKLQNSEGKSRTRSGGGVGAVAQAAQLI